MVNIHQEIFPQIVEQVQMMELLRDNETVMDFMIRITVSDQLFLVADPECDARGVSLTRLTLARLHNAG